MQIGAGVGLPSQEPEKKKKKKKQTAYKPMNREEQRPRPRGSSGQLRGMKDRNAPFPWTRTVWLASREIPVEFSSFMEKSQ
jgi:hypothetical protein